MPHASPRTDDDDLLLVPSDAARRFADVREGESDPRAVIAYVTLAFGGVWAAGALATLLRWL